MVKAIWHRKRILVNTDPQRRCYDGVHISIELRWSEWACLERLRPTTDVERRLQFWRELNDYAVSARGESARTEFKIADAPPE